MTRFVLGVIGHVDHGKTALVRALTGTDTDRLVEEKQRGISIALGFAHLTLASGTAVDLIDMPGHERFVRTMIAGATGIDAVLLVVTATEGIKPQTTEHIDIARLLGIHEAVIAITKTDLVTRARALQVADEVRQLLVSADIESLPPVMTAAVQNIGIEELRETLDALAAKHRERASDGVAFLPIDRAFSIAGHGPVVTGTLRGAAVNRGDTLELFPARRTSQVRGVQVHGSRVDVAAPGQRVAFNLRDIEVAELEHGMVLAAPGSLAPTEWLTIGIHAVAGIRPLRNGVRLRALFGTSEIDVRLRLLDRDVLEASQSGFAQLHCAVPVALPAREHVILRIASPARTVAGGKVLEAATHRQRRHDAQSLARLAELLTLPPAAAIAVEVQRDSATVHTIESLSRLAALAAPRVREVLQALPVFVTRAGDVLRTADIDDLLTRVPALLAVHAAGLPREKLQTLLVVRTPALLEEALTRLVTRGVIIERGRQLLLPRPDEDRERALDEAELAGQIAETLRRSGLTPPNPSVIVTDARSKHAVDRLLTAGLVVRAVDRAKGREMLFHRDAITEARRRLAPLLEQPRGLLVTEIGAALGITRKHTMPLLDHLDAIRFTRRVDDRRIKA